MNLHVLSLNLAWPTHHRRSLLRGWQMILQFDRRIVWRGRDRWNSLDWGGRRRRSIRVLEGRLEIGGSIGWKRIRWNRWRFHSVCASIIRILHRIWRGIYHRWRISIAFLSTWIVHWRHAWIHRIGLGRRIGRMIWIGRSETTRIAVRGWVVVRRRVAWVLWIVAVVDRGRHGLHGRGMIGWRNAIPGREWIRHGSWCCRIRTRSIEEFGNRMPLLVPPFGICTWRIRIT